ncbi:MAG TPA: hypothetical protein VFS47_10350 [Steroidobacteraceae bacterium]|nr:hypothetical protein [Steroidobacteraceae bacterium]
MSKSRAYLLGAALISLVLTVVFGDLPGRGLFVGALQNSAHVPASGAIAALLLVLCRHWPLSRKWTALTRYVAVVLVTTTIGAAIEVIQGALHRDMSLEDVFHDFLGALIGAAVMHTCGWEPSSNRLRKTSLVLACVAVLIAAFPVAWSAAAYIHRDREFPFVLQFGSRLDRYFLYDCAAHSKFAKIEQMKSGSALVVELDPTCRKQIGVAEPYADWRGYSRLKLEITNTANEPIPLTIRIEDIHHNQEYTDRFNQSFDLAGNEYKILTIPLDAVRNAPAGRQMDMQHIYWINLFTSLEHPTARVALHRMWLE